MSPRPPNYFSWHSSAKICRLKNIKKSIENLWKVNKQWLHGDDYIVAYVRAIKKVVLSSSCRQAGWPYCAHLYPPKCNGEKGYFECKNKFRNCKRKEGEEEMSGTGWWYAQQPKKEAILQSHELFQTSPFSNQIVAARSDYCWIWGISVTRFGEISPLWQNS